MDQQHHLESPLNRKPIEIYNKSLCKGHRSFNFHCGLSLGVDRPGQPVAVIYDQRP